MSPIWLPALERKLIFAPLAYPSGDWHPDDLAFEDAWITTGSGERIHGWFVDPGSPRAVILYCHGNYGNVSHRGALLRHITERYRVAMLVFDYRGYGRSEGTPTEQNILGDARAARDWLARKTGIAPADIVLMGRSLGGAVAIDLAAEDGARGLIVESTFTSLPDVGAYHYPWLPVRTLMRHRLDSLKKISQYHGPLLMSHGDADRVIPFEQGQQLFEAANRPKEFVTIRGGDHNSPQSEAYYEALGRFLDSLPPGRPAGAR